MAIKDKYLDERITTTVVSLPPLPFFHSCEAVHLQSILDCKELQPRYCDVYKENLLYLFYGKPAYKSAEPANSGFNFLMPVTFIIKNDAVTTIKRAVAFDSGAYDLYAVHMHKAMKREEFYLSPTKDALNKMVNYFFNNNDSYYEGDAKKVLDAYDPVHFQLESYHSILTSNHKTELDDRKSSIEVQLEYAIPLTNKNIEAIILPKHLAGSPTIRDILDTADIPVIPIKNYGVASKNYYVHVLEVVRSLLVKKKLLNDN